MAVTASGPCRRTPAPDRHGRTRACTFQLFLTTRPAPSCSAREEQRETRLPWGWQRIAAELHPQLPAWRLCCRDVTAATPRAEEPSPSPPLGRSATARGAAGQHCASPSGRVAVTRAAPPVTRRRSDRGCGRKAQGEEPQAGVPAATAQDGGTTAPGEATSAAGVGAYGSSPGTRGNLPWSSEAVNNGAQRSEAETRPEAGLLSAAGSDRVKPLPPRGHSHSSALASQALPSPGRAPRRTAPACFGPGPFPVGPGRNSSISAPAGQKNESKALVPGLQCPRAPRGWDFPREGSSTERADRTTRQRSRLTGSTFPLTQRRSRTVEPRGFAGGAFLPTARHRAV